MTILLTASRLNWAGWLRGVIGAMISGGSSAITAGFSVSVVDGKDWSPLQGGAGHLLMLMGTCFIISGIISMMKFLQTHPLPDLDGSNVTT